MTSSNVAAVSADGLVNGRADGQFGGFFWPVLGEQRHQSIRQVGFDLAQQFSQGSRAGRLDPEVIVLIQQIIPDEQQGTAPSVCP